MKSLLSVVALTTILTVTSVLSDELRWEFVYREDKLSDERLPVVGADLSLGEGADNYLEISMQCDLQNPVYQNPVYFQIIRVSSDVNACDKTGYFVIPSGFRDGGVRIPYKFRIDNGPSVDAAWNPEYCNEFKIPVWLDREASNLPFNLVATVFRTQRLRIEVRLVRGERPVIDISMRDSAIQKFVSACKPLREILSK